MDAPINTCCKNKIKITAPSISFNKNAAKPVTTSDEVKQVIHSVRVKHSPRKSIDSTDSSNTSLTNSSIKSKGKHSKSKSVRSNENSLDRNCFLYYNRKQLNQAIYIEPCRIRQQQQFNPSYNFYGNANCFSGLFSVAY